MGSPQEETAKRLAIADRQCDRFRDIASGMLLTGSVAYAPNENVTPSSDVDLVVVTESPKTALDIAVSNRDERNALRSRFFDGYCTKHDEHGVPVSVHLISTDAFDVICKSFVATLRVYRPLPKNGTYDLRGFEGNAYEYKIKNVPLPEFEGGVRTIVPVSFIAEDRYYLGIHRDKLISAPSIRHGDDFLSSRIEKLWRIVVENLVDESRRLYGDIDLARMNILNALAKADKMSPAARQTVIDKTEFFVSELVQ